MKFFSELARREIYISGVTKTTAGARRRLTGRAWPGTDTVAEVTGNMSQNGKRAGGYSAPTSCLGPQGRGPGSPLNVKLECRIMSKKEKEGKFGGEPPMAQLLSHFFPG